MKKELVIIIDDDAVLRCSLKILLENAGYCVKAFAGLADFRDYAIPDTPACLLLDVNLVDGNGLDILESEEDDRRLPTIIITGMSDITIAVQALRLGAVDFLTKPIAPATVTTAVQKALEQGREAYRRRRRLVTLRSRFERLSPREQEVFEGVVQGKLNKQIGMDLGIAEKTVKVHRSNMMRKMGMDSVADLVRAAIELEEEGDVLPSAAGSSRNRN